jgi:hypothetical protein
MSTARSSAVVVRRLTSCWYAARDQVFAGGEVAVERALTAPYTPRYDWQGVSDEATMEAIRARVPRMALT